MAPPASPDFNVYVQALGPFYRKTPKDVFAALAYACAADGETNPEIVLARLKSSWMELQYQGILSQPAPGSGAHWRRVRTHPPKARASRV